MMQESRNPIYDVNGSGTTLKGLSDEIRAGILNLGEPDSSRADLQRDIENISQTAAGERSPDIMLNLMLFRKYAEIANHIKDSRRHGAMALLVDLPSFAETDESQLAGWAALREKIFWLRLSAALLAFICFVVMASVQDIGTADFKPRKHLANGCVVTNLQGSFSFRAYEIVISLGVMIYCYNAVFAVYYLLPTDVHKRKFVPGLASLLGKCMEKDRADSWVLSGSMFCKSFSKFIECVLDGLLLLVAAAVALIASIALERSSDFTYTMAYPYTGYRFPATTTYFTIGSIYASFSHMTPVCLHESDNPGPKIRGSLAMLYLTLFLLSLCFIVSYSAFRKELRGDAVHGLLRGDADQEEVVEFRALPSSPEEAGDAQHREDGARGMSV